MTAVPAGYRATSALHLKRLGMVLLWCRSQTIYIPQFIFQFCSQVNQQTRSIRLEMTLLKNRSLMVLSCFANLYTPPNAKVEAAQCKHSPATKRSIISLPRTLFIDYFKRYVLEVPELDFTENKKYASMINGRLILHLYIVLVYPILCLPVHFSVLSDLSKSVTPKDFFICWYLLYSF